MAMMHSDSFAMSSEVGAAHSWSDDGSDTPPSDI